MKPHGLSRALAGKVHQAFVAGGAPADKAQAAVAELAAYRDRWASMDARLSVLTWVAAANLALTAAALLKLFH